MTDTSSLQHTLTFSNTQGATEPASVQLVVDEANPTVPPMIIQRILAGGVCRNGGTLPTHLAVGGTACPTTGHPELLPWLTPTKEEASH